MLPSAKREECTQEVMQSEGDSARISRQVLPDETKKKKEKNKGRGQKGFDPSTQAVIGIDTGSTGPSSPVHLTQSLCGGPERSGRPEARGICWPLGFRQSPP